MCLQARFGLEKASNILGQEWNFQQLYSPKRKYNHSLVVCLIVMAGVQEEEEKSKDTLCKPKSLPSLIERLLREIHAFHFYPQDMGM